MTIHHGKLYHAMPGWVGTGARFHIRIRLARDTRPLTHADIAPRLLQSAAFYHERNRWYAWLFLLMPDHLHAVLSFPQTLSMSRVVGDWKKYQERELKVDWQEGYFDHRLRSDNEFAEKCSYIRMNPVRADLCIDPADWPWLSEPWKSDGIARE